MNELTKPDELTDLAPKLDAAVATASDVFTNSARSLAESLRLGDAVEHLRRLLDMPPVKNRVMSLMNTQVGFLTDRLPGAISRKTGRPVEPYEWPVVRESALVALLAGCRLIGNEFNLLSSRCYITRQGFLGKIQRHPDVSGFKSTIGIPKQASGGFIVPCSAEWLQGGNKQSLTVEIFVRSDEYTMPDAIIGKAERKLWRRVWETICGRPELTADGEVGETKEPPAVRPPQIVDVTPAEPARKPDTDRPGLTGLRELLAKDNITEIALCDWLLERGTIKTRTDTVADLPDHLIDNLIKFWPKTVKLVRAWLESIPPTEVTP